MSTVVIATDTSVSGRQVRQRDCYITGNFSAENAGTPMLLKRYIMEWKQSQQQAGRSERLKAAAGCQEQAEGCSGCLENVLDLPE